MQIEDLTNPERVELEAWSMEIDPNAPANAWCQAYTCYTIAGPDGSVQRQEVAAGPDTLTAMTIPALICAAQVRRDEDELHRIRAIMDRTGPLTQAIACANAIAMLARTARNNPAGIEHARERAAIPAELQLAISGEIEIKDPEKLGASISLILTGIEDRTEATFAAARFLAATAEGREEQLAASMETYAENWPKHRYIGSDGERRETP